MSGSQLSQELFLSPEFITVSELPRHVVQQIEEDRRRQERERERREYERSLCKVHVGEEEGQSVTEWLTSLSLPSPQFRLFARHPESGEALERRIEVNQHWTYQETVAEAHKVTQTADTRIHSLTHSLLSPRQLLEFEAVLPVARCRLVKYDEYTETLDQSFEGIEVSDRERDTTSWFYQSTISHSQGETFGQMVGGPRNYYSFELFLETRAEDEVFKPYNRGGVACGLYVGYIHI